MNPVFQAEDDGKWYFWDETELYAYGPYDTEELAKADMTEYCVQLFGN